MWGEFWSVFEVEDLMSNRTHVFSDIWKWCEVYEVYDVPFMFSPTMLYYINGGYGNIGISYSEAIFFFLLYFIRTLLGLGWHPQATNFAAGCLRYSKGKKASEGRRNTGGFTLWCPFGTPGCLQVGRWDLASWWNKCSSSVLNIFQLDILDNVASLFSHRFFGINVCKINAAQKLVTYVSRDDFFSRFLVRFSERTVARLSGRSLGKIEPKSG